MEFEIGAFTQRLIDLFANSKQVPNMGGSYTNRFGYTQEDSSKHPNRPTPRDLNYQIWNCMNSTKSGMDNIMQFDLGSEFMEEYFPYYHILQQAPVIRKRGKGSEKTKGSQEKIADIKKRNYERVSFNGKIYSKEYARNVRGQRLNLSRTSYWKEDVGFWNGSAKQYLNKHYQYIDKICDEISLIIAQEYGMKLGRKKDTGLEEEYELDNILDIMYSFN